MSEDLGKCTSFSGIIYSPSGFIGEAERGLIGKTITHADGKILGKITNVKLEGKNYLRYVAEVVDPK